MYRTRAYLASLLALMLVLACATPASAVSAADARKHARAAETARKKAADQKQLAEKLKRETARLDGIVDGLQAEADALDPLISSAARRTARLRDDVNALRAQIRAKQAEIDETQARYEEEQGYFQGRVEADYKQGSLFYLDMLFDAQDVGNFIARTEFIGRVIKSSNDIAERLVSTREALSRARAELDRALETVNAKRREAETAENKLRSLRDARQAKTDQQNAVLGKKSALLTQSRKNMKRLLAVAAAEEAESSRIQAMLGGNGSGHYNGVMAWPVPGFYRVTSSFGWRVHPIFRTRRFHAGIDVGRNGSQQILGAAIIAAGSGTVIWAGPRGGYGNVVMIDHGNGVVSLYAHQRSGGIKVSNGQHVKKGTRIGTVGSTGYSTGAHLHFEVRVNGVPKNPMTYVR
jgi:murein DD-endopeptidase MepM/ murein hydrolase activator NlpD